MKTVPNQMVFRVLLAVVLGGVSMLASACPKSEAPDEEKILAVVRQNVEAANEEDLESYLDTIDEDSPYYKTTEAVVPRRFDKYDLEIELVEARIAKVEGGRASVTFVENIRKKEGPEFKDVRVEGEFILHRDKKGRWKIEDTIREKIEPLPALEKPAGDKPVNP